MIANPTVAELVFRILFLFGYALLFALVEIEIEGEHGWAERLPTWFRVTPWYARLYGRLMNGKPLTGYHAVMFVLPIWSFHIGFAGGVPWSWAAEATTMSAYLIWAAVWDLLWFLFHPRYGWRRFVPNTIWWHRRWIGRFPADYLGALFGSTAFAASAVLTAGDLGVLWNHLKLLAGFVGLTVLATAAAPAYVRHYAHMRRAGADERHLCIPSKSETQP
jgi:hypothetical protein